MEFASLKCVCFQTKIGSSALRKVMEEARRRTVVAMKHGKTLCLDFGDMGSGCPFKEVNCATNLCLRLGNHTALIKVALAPTLQVFCKETTIDERLFEAGGKKIIMGKPTPFCKKMWKDNEKMSGEIVIDNDFQVVCLTNQPPADVLRELEEPLPLQHLHPIVVLSGS
jgi:hypothetical protein